MQRPTPIDEDEAVPPSSGTPEAGPLAESAETAGTDAVVVTLADAEVDGSDEASPLIPPHVRDPQPPSPRPSASARVPLYLPQHGAAATNGVLPGPDTGSRSAGSPAAAPVRAECPVGAADGAATARLSPRLHPADAVLGSPSVSGSVVLPASSPGIVPNSVTDSSVGLTGAVARDASEDASRGTQSLSVADMHEGATAAVGDGSVPAAAQSPDRDFPTPREESADGDAVLDQVALAAQRIPTMACKPPYTGLTHLEDRMHSSTAAAGWATGQSSWLTDSSAAVAAADALRASGSTAMPSGSEEVSHGASAVGSAPGSVHETPSCWPCRRPRLRRPRRLWEPEPEDGLAGVTRLSPWLFSTANSSAMPGASAARSTRDRARSSHRANAACMRSRARIERWAAGQSLWPRLAKLAVAVVAHAGISTAVCMQTSARLRCRRETGATRPSCLCTASTAA